MSRTSTDLPESRRFRRAFTGIVCTVVALCGLFLTLGYFQGPRLSSAQVDTNAVITQGNQQLRLFANQTVAQVSDGQVTITPATSFSVSTAEDVIAVQFDERLRYATDYTVRIAGVTSAYLPQPSTITYSFTTGSPELFFLDRGVPDDQIISTGLSGSDRETVFSGTRIQDFRPLLNSVAVVSLNDDRTSTLELVSLRDDVVEKVLLPDAASIGKVDAASSGTVIGFTLTSADAGIGQINSNTLYTIDLDAGRIVSPVLGLDGQPLRVMGWQFIPGSSNLLALSNDRSLLMIDPAAGTVTPLGQFSEFGKVSTDGAVVTMIDPRGPVALTIADGSQRRLMASPVQGEDGFLGATAMLTGADRIEKVVIPDEGGTRFASLLVYDDGRESRILYQTPDAQGGISDFSISPNGQYVAIETVPNNASSVSDDYFYDARSTSVTTIIVEIASGAQVRSFEGFALDW